MSLKRPRSEDEYYVDFNDPESLAPDEDLIFKGYPIVLQTTNGHLLKKLITGMKSFCDSMPIHWLFFPDKVRIVGTPPDGMTSIIATLPGESIANYYCKAKIRLALDPKLLMQHFASVEAKQTVTIKVKDNSAMQLVIDEPLRGGGYLEYTEPSQGVELKLLKPPDVMEHVFRFKIPLAVFQLALKGLKDDSSDSDDYLIFRGSTDRFQFIGKGGNNHTYFHSPTNELGFVEAGETTRDAQFTMKSLELLNKVMTPLKSTITVEMSPDLLKITQKINEDWEVVYFTTEQEAST